MYSNHGFPGRFMPPTERLYYHDSFLYSFDAQVLECAERGGRAAILLDRTAFYPTSGGQVHDTGTFMLEDETEISVSEVAEEDDGGIWHFVSAPVPSGRKVRGRLV